jgi:ABC-type Mn2+/Zn2+ transport system ATPase subunit
LYKFQVTIQFQMDDAFMSYVPDHRKYINSLINKGVIDYYSVSMESMQCWMIINAQNKKAVETILKKTPLNKYWEFQIHELFVYDSSSYRLPELVYN